MWLNECDYYAYIIGYEHQFKNYIYPKGRERQHFADTMSTFNSTLKARVTSEGSKLEINHLLPVKHTVHLVLFEYVIPIPGFYSPLGSLGWILVQ